MTVVCGTDFSENAQHAVRVAAAFGRAWQETLVLVHVVEEGTLPAGARAVADAWSIAARGRLEEIAKSLRGGGLEVEARVVVGTPDEKLAGIGETPGVRLVVVGFLGRRSADRWRAGSLPARLARSIAVPVLVVKDAEAFERARVADGRCACSWPLISPWLPMPRWDGWARCGASGLVRSPCFTRTIRSEKLRVWESVGEGRSRAAPK